MKNSFLSYNHIINLDNIRRKINLKNYFKLILIDIKNQQWSVSRIQSHDMIE